ncbi:MAG: hypothetical protein GXD23_09345 [Comamonadaceae bacterium]|uniref:DUF6134 family protein n=1 Tax=Hydrogenophaga TaxID=47420 RepID=UPI0011C15158|nr:MULTISPECIES: DUF6134 family protein [Hydrogenophaga]NCT97560.1 hypothetical protein [Comamonadaceae bacterium]WQB83225.1 DUF6134 family protein [Hydrogenophaga sp. SNF1]
MRAWGGWALAWLLAGAAAAPARAEVWAFEVRLDGRPIGSHRFELSGPPEAREVQSVARMDVTLLGVPLYRYRHEARERWRGDCLDGVSARTNDGGEASQVEWPDDTAGAGGPVRPACLMSYAYWNAALTRQTQLLNPQTGQLDAVRFERLADAPLAVNGREVPAVRWRLIATAPAPAATRQTLTLWLERSSGRWIGLDALVRGDRLLSYRLP